tara:strand:- start:281 stop:535 length:255 start_codon:yes stop_codon:yes gene_type:complete
MRIKKVLVSFEVQEKIFKKHNVTREQIENVFFDEPYVFRSKEGRYVAIGNEYITVVFDYDNGDAEIVTAYRSSRWQKRLYKVKK